MMAYTKERRDTYMGKVICATRKGVYLTLEDGSEAFAFFNALKAGTQVRCSINKNATEKLKTLVDIESVYYDDFTIQNDKGELEYA